MLGRVLPIFWPLELVKSEPPKIFGLVFVFVEPFWFCVSVPPKMFGREDEIFRPERSYVSTPPKMLGRVEVLVPSVQVLSVPPKIFGRLVQLALAGVGATTTGSAMMNRTSNFMNIEDLALLTPDLQIHEKAISSSSFIQPPGRNRTVPLLVLIPRLPLHQGRRLLAFDLPRCFPSSTDRQSFVRDLPMSS